MIPRPHLVQAIRAGFRVHPVVALLGPRQCGKTTLARALAGSEPSTYFDLEDPVDRARLEHPARTLGALTGLVVLDELQRGEGLMEVLRVLVDRSPDRARFLILGSASPHMVRGASETLAGRIGFVDMTGFSLDEVGVENRERLWLRGGFPRSFLAADEEASWAWREGFVRTFLERDIPQLGVTIPAETLRRFWSMVAHFHGQVWNAAEFARSLGTGETTARRHLDVLAGAYMVRILPPWFENLRKRQVKAPKIYLRDSGILHSLLGPRTPHDLSGHPKLGASWEGFVLEQLLTRVPTRDAYFWGTHGGAELDLLMFLRGRRLGFEFKYGDAPRSTRSMRVALEDLGLEHLWIVCPGDAHHEVDDKITVLPLQALPELVGELTSPPATGSTI